MPSTIDSEANDDGKEATEQCASWEVDRMRTVDHESGAALGAQVRRHLAAPHLPPPAPPGPLQRQIDRTAAEREVPRRTWSTVLQWRGHCGWRGHWRRAGIRLCVRLIALHLIALRLIVIVRHGAVTVVALT